MEWYGGERLETEGEEVTESKTRIQKKAITVAREMIMKLNKNKIKKMIRGDIDNGEKGGKRTNMGNE